MLSLTILLRNVEEHVFISLFTVIDTSMKASQDFGSTKDEVLHSALNLALGGEFINTKIYAFSRRTTSGLVYKPRPIYTNSLTLKATSGFFDGLLSAGFSESQTTFLDDDDQYIEQMSTNLYEYDSDSDLEDEELGTKRLMPMLNVAPPEEKEARYFESTSLVHQKRSSRTAAIPHDTSSRPCGRTVFLRSVAFKTLKAFAFYAFTGKLAFAPLRSRVLHDGVGLADPSGSVKAFHPPLCSPKSMYRLAEMLQDLALVEITKNLTPKTIMDELFSSFTSQYFFHFKTRLNAFPHIGFIEIRYPLVEKTELDYLLGSTIPSNIMLELSELIIKMSNGSQPHACHALAALIGILVNNHNTIRSNPPPPVSDSDCSSAAVYRTTEFIKR
ncbi:uncharacterized protein FIBRA_01666 [Fibroporia radiculosa]|uniref:Uncharacterized protein n=1 Tax=Fibroporia radiculosa TaxID=599839 RepID=J4I8M0_9APHY|nr:uncharacterized protein FIBRA_01666 [Fibroporia radiculosa]CCL99646.1 predicted protein [Fibroporia radiculosa]